ncbi:MAG: adenylosuccinate synthase [Bacilli bacterium]|jgi:adenylosuccinate synthase|nr:adenylosuccinate synthase [Bacilli bacterium]
MSKTAVVIGCQWGDEGKGKITNYLSERADVVVRYQGGDNAGHTIVFQNRTFKLHLIPSGVFSAHTKNILGNGMVINPRSFLQEVKTLQAEGFACDNVYISDRAHVLFDYHQYFDVIFEEQLGDQKIGTTKKGIGPAYTDKAARVGIRMADFISPDFPERFRHKLEKVNQELAFYQKMPYAVEEKVQEYQILAEAIKPYVCDTIELLHEEEQKGAKILFEGAQGALLDIDFGTYPFVTSSNPSSGGVVIGSGIGLTKIQEVIGIVKAYSTRVGAGPFPTELNNALGDHIREVGHEYGTTTKRPRRIGWLDAAVLRYSTLINGVTGISLMLLDVLSGLEEIKIATHYELDGRNCQFIPARLEDYGRCKPVYISLSGWKEDITEVKSFEELPAAAKQYIATIEQLTGVPVVCFSVGPDQKQTVIRKEIF